MAIDRRVEPTDEFGKRLWALDFVGNGRGFNEGLVEVDAEGKRFVIVHRG